MTVNYFVILNIIIYISDMTVNAPLIRANHQYAPRSLQPLHLGGSIDGLLHGENGHISLRMFFHLCSIIVFLHIGKGSLLNCMIM